MKVVVVGCGHVGLVTAAALAEWGHEVVGVDSDPDRLAALRGGFVPFYEPGLDELLSRHRIRFEGEVAQAMDACDAVFICVSTPRRGDGRPSLSHVEQAARAVAEAAVGPTVVVEKSTVPVHTARRIIGVLAEAGRYPEIEVVCNPEFLREGTAIRDALFPDRIVVGLAGGGRAEAVMRELYAPAVERTGCPLVVTDIETAEVIKHASNSFLATKVSFINWVAAVCEAVGADVDVVAHAMGLDPRIGPQHLRAGVGYGGSCFPKDVAAFAALASELGLSSELLRAVEDVNRAQRRRLVEKVARAVWNLDGKTLAVWGLAYKAHTDDLRDSPALEVIPMLQAQGARVRAYDPEAGGAAKGVLRDAEVVPDPWSAVEGADCLVVLTDWPEFAEVDLERLKGALRRPVVVDGRNIWPVAEMARLGFTYLSVGRPDVVAGEVRRPPPRW